MEEERSETKVAVPLSTGELAAYGVKPILGQSSMGQLRAVYGGSIKPALWIRQSAAAAISAGTAGLLRAAGQQSAMSARLYLRAHGAAVSAAAVPIKQRRKT